ncbi:hypothetical protein C8R47DRAFT_1072625 [Mycena vitilis]|nr:hypothetical protein C8R47DRAFT_1072625 [Mycena vitilis]
MVPGVEFWDRMECRMVVDRDWCRRCRSGASAMLGPVLTIQAWAAGGVFLRKKVGTSIEWQWSDEGHSPGLQAVRGALRRCLEAGGVMRTWTSSVGHGMLHVWTPCAHRRFLTLTVTEKIRKWQDQDESKMRATNESPPRISVRSRDVDT